MTKLALVQLTSGPSSGGYPEIIRQALLNLLPTLSF
jgi:hypothetical protein